MAILGKKDILDCNDRSTITVYVPEWGGDVIISLMSASDMDSYEDSLIEGKGKINIKNARAKLLAAVLVDEEGNQIFTTKDVTALGKKSTKAVAKIYKAAMQFNSLTEEELESLIKN